MPGIDTPRRVGLEPIAIDISKLVLIPCATVSNALWTTLQPFFSANRLQKYLANDARELCTHVLCLVSLCLAVNYTREDYEAVKVGLLHKESILSFTVLLLWIRLVQVMKIFSSTGALVAERLRSRSRRLNESL